MLYISYSKVTREVSDHHSANWHWSSWKTSLFESGWGLLFFRSVLLVLILSFVRGSPQRERSIILTSIVMGEPCLLIDCHGFQISLKIFMSMTFKRRRLKMTLRSEHTKQKFNKWFALFSPRQSLPIITLPIILRIKMGEGEEEQDNLSILLIQEQDIELAGLLIHHNLQRGQH